MESSSEFEYKSIQSYNQQYNMEADEFKLVFINSSDSSSSCKEDEVDDNISTTSSTRNCHSIVFDEGDWDYFEPSMQVKSQILYSPCASPLIMRRFSCEFKSSDSSTMSPTNSPQTLRKIRESDTGTDEELLMQGESSSSDGHLARPLHLGLKTRIKTRLLNKEHYYQQQLQRQQSRLACSCGGNSKTKKQLHNPQPQYVPIPVPVPKYRLALKEKCPCCVFGKVDDGKSSEATSQATTNENESKA